jgi:enoyl-CoA hydratase/carnithine racemase
MNAMVRTQLADGVFHLAMARPEKKNALTATMYRTMADALAAADADPACR